MFSTTVLQFVVATLLPVVVTALFYLLEKRTAFSATSYKAKQAIIGLVFGLVAVFGTEFGINASGAIMNVRDAAPIAAGLLFGGPAGIVAGLIGGIERWFAAYWGRGEFTQLACSVATIAAGFYAAVLRKYLFDNKRPTWVFALVIGIVAEVLHLTLIFITNIDQIEQAIQVVQACTGPMVLCNGVSVMLSAIVATLLSKERIRSRAEDRPISQSVQLGMLVSVLVAFVATMAFTNSMQTAISRAQTYELLELNISDVQSDIQEIADNNMLIVAQSVAEIIGSVDEAKKLPLKDYASDIGLSEINVVDTSGKVAASNLADYVGYNMSSNEQSKEFMVLLDGSQQEYVQGYQSMGFHNGVWRKYAGVAIDGGFLQVGFNASELQNQIVSQVVSVVQNRHVGETGRLLICDAKGSLLGASSEANSETLASTGLQDAIDSTPSGKLFKAAYMGDPVYGVYEETEGYKVIAILPEAEAAFGRNTAVLISAYLEILIFAILFTVIYLLIKRLVVNNIRSVNASLSKITDGDLNARVDVRTNQEFASLSDDINQTVDALNQAIKEADARIDAELEYARVIQRSALPMVFPPYPTHDDFQIYASMDAAKEVGGDFYDFYLIDDDHLAFLIADVSGKGIPAALFMMNAKTLLKGLAQSGLSPEQVLTRGNNQLCEGNEAEMFVTAWMGVLDLDTGVVTFANAGHNPPAITHRGGQFGYHVVRPNLVLAGMEETRYKSNTLTLEQGDTIFLYTDGVTEATDVHDELFGDDRLLESLNANAENSVETLCKEIHNAVDAFVDGAPQFDDITVMALRYMGRSERGTDA